MEFSWLIMGQVVEVSVSLSWGWTCGVVACHCAAEMGCLVPAKMLNVHGRTLEQSIYSFTGTTLNRVCVKSLSNEGWSLTGHFCIQNGSGIIKLQR